MFSKSSKKMMSMLLTLCMLLCSSIVPVGALASTDVVFDLDVASLTDSSANNVDVTSSGTITKGDFTNSSGTSVPYMTTATSSVSKNDGQSGFLTVTDTDVTKLEDYTIETWMRFHSPTNDIYPKIFIQKNDTTNIFLAEITAAGNKVSMNNTHKFVNTFSSANVNEKWCHYVFTFDTIKDEDGNITSAKPRIYVDGVYTGSSFTSEQVFNSAADLALIGTGTQFLIGGYSGLGFPADFATFKIYNTVKTADEVEALYDASAANYLEGTVNPDSEVVFDLDVETFEDNSASRVNVTSNGTITKGDFTNSSGTSVPYMTTATSDVSMSNNVGGYLSFNDSKVTALTDYTIETWARFHMPTDTSIGPRMFFHRGSGKNLFTFEMGSANKSGNKNALTVLEVSGRIPDTFSNSNVNEKWCHYVFTFDTVYDASNAVTAVKPKIYVDGVYTASSYTSEPSVTQNLSYVGTGDEFWLGGYSKLSFPADFATFKIYNTVKTADEVEALYNASSADYVEMEDVRPNAGELSINLGKEISAESLANNVTLQKVGDNESLTNAPGGIYATVSADNANVAELKFGMLDANSTYRITFSGTVAFTDGTTLGTAKTIDFNTGKSVLLSTEFDDYTAGTLNKDGLKYRNGSNADDASAMSVETITVGESTDTVLRMTKSAQNTLYWVIYEMEQALQQDEVLIVKEKVRPYNGTTQAFTDGGGQYILRFRDAAATQAPNNAPVYYLNDSSYKDADSDFFNVISRVIYSKDTNTFQATREAANGHTDTPRNLGVTDIKDIIPIQIYDTQDAAADYMDLSSLHIELGIAPEILHTAYDKDDKTVTVVFNDDMTDVSASTLKLLKDNGDESHTEITSTIVNYDAANRVATITLSEELADGDYLVNVTDAVSPAAAKWTGYAEFSVMDPMEISTVFKAGSSEITNNVIPANSTTVSADVTVTNNTASPVNCVLIAALYEGEQLVKVTAFNDVTVPANTNAVNYTNKTLTIDGITTGSNAKMKVFIWNSATALKPLLPYVQVGTTE